LKTLSIGEPLPVVNQAGTGLWVMSQARFFSLDVLRGFAVMGILVMNIIAFALPMSAYLNPKAFGTHGPTDIAAWAIAFVVIDGKMRGLFSMLFGASLLLIVTRAEQSGDNAARIHYRRMIWLLVLGLLHGWFIWDGDILALYALCGMAAYLLRPLPPKQLMIISGTLILANTLLWALILLTAHGLRHQAVALGAAAARASYLEMADALGAPGGASIVQDLHAYHEPYWAMIQTRLAAFPGSLFEFVYGYGLETLGLMAWGMALFQAGALTGQWTLRRLAQAAILAYGFGLPASIALAHWAYQADFETLVTADIYYIFNTPARLAVMLGHLFALSAFIQAKSTKTWLLSRVAAAGRMAFSNYILTSLLMTSLFYGYGFGLYGHVSRASAYIAVPLMWVLMLIWSPLWLKYFAYGPLEWLWRSLARGKVQAFRLK
ncbi:MAG: DUF418 domain-containing protein, partial [Alphaproteobacteria bacterium]|nr:DUF418 domain-containing protein [Alphaproteobacteria bacterium]